MKIAVSCAFGENAIQAITNTAQARGVLETRIVPDRELLIDMLGLLKKTSPEASAKRAYVNRMLARVRAQASDRDVYGSRTSELVRILGGRLKSPLSYWLGNSTWKKMHDKAASRIDLGAADVVIGMPGSSLFTFQNSPERVKVFHEVDAHPKVRNQRLVDVYGRRRAKAEMYSPRFVERIEAEIRISDYILVPSGLVQRQMLANGVDHEKIITIPYGVNPRIFAPIDQDVQRRPDLNQLQVVYTGQVSLRKGVPFLIEAVRGVPNIQLTIVGPVFDRGILVNLPDNVRVAGVLSPEQLSALYGRMDVFVLPSIEDSCGLVVAEAAAAGLPVITTSWSGASELLSSPHVVVEPGDVGVLRDAILSKNYLSQSEREQIARGARRGMFDTWDQYGTNVLNRLESVAK